MKMLNLSMKVLKDVKYWMLNSVFILNLGSCESKNCLKRRVIPKLKKVMKKSFLTWNLTKGLRFQAKYGTNCTSKSWLTLQTMFTVKLSVDQPIKQSVSQQVF